jgi:hypothetical protein
MPPERIPEAIAMDMVSSTSVSSCLHDGYHRRSLRGILILPQQCEAFQYLATGQVTP